MAEYENYDSKPKGYMNPYAEKSAGAAMEACYNACQTCKYSMDHRMMLQCCNPKRAKIMVYDVQGRAEADEGFYLQENSNYCVEPNWWCKEFSAQDIDNSPGQYSTGGSMGGAAAGS